MNPHLASKEMDARSCPGGDDLLAFASGRLAEPSSVEIAKHVGQCSDCELFLESHSRPLWRVDPRGRLFEGEPEVQRMIAAAKALLADARPQQSAESVSTKTELATEGFSKSESKTRTYRAQVPEGLGRYHIDAILGEGAFGKVFRAYDRELDRLIAIKLSHPEQEAVFQQSLLDEARLAAQLRHPGIVAIYDVGRASDGSTFVVMEYVDGQSLRELLARERPSVDRAARIIEEVAKAVHYAHKRGLIHRDLKPSNLLIDHQGDVRVADFGLALVEDQQRSRAGEFAGTPAYMSPEQVRGEAHRLDGRTDVWALGVILYEMLTGRRPFQGKRGEVLDEIQHRAPKPPRQYDERIPIEVERACLKCLEKQPERRYSTALDLAEELARWRDPRGRKRRAWPLVLAAAAACLLAVGGGVGLLVALHGVSGRTIGAASSMSRVDLDSPENLFRWQPLLDRPPRPLFEPTDIRERWSYDAVRKDVQVSSPAPCFLEMGETKSPGYKLKVGMARTGGRGWAGLFFGYQPTAPRNGRRTWSCQAISLDSSASNKLIIRRDLIELQEVQNTFTSNCRRYNWIEVPSYGANVRYLTFSVSDRKVDEVRWEGEPLSKLCDLKGQPSVGPCDGKFGVVNCQGTTVFSDVEYELLWSSKQ
jgi:predicted Ser/Thr protein kinase